MAVVSEMQIAHPSELAPEYAEAFEIVGVALQSLVWLMQRMSMVWLTVGALAKVVSVLQAFGTA